MNCLDIEHITLAVVGIVAILALVISGGIPVGSASFEDKSCSPGFTCVEGNKHDSCPVGFLCEIDGKKLKKCKLDMGNGICVQEEVLCCIPDLIAVDPTQPQLCCSGRIEPGSFQTRTEGFEGVCDNNWDPGLGQSLCALSCPCDFGSVPYLDCQEYKDLYICNTVTTSQSASILWNGLPESHCRDAFGGAPLTSVAQANACVNALNSICTATNCPLDRFV